MKYSGDIQLVETIPERCRVCYTCIRECPAKAIRVADGQAQVIPHRCIGCGNCVRVCTQRAKRVLDCASVFRRLLHNGRRIAACLAPSFPAEFSDIPWRKLVGMLKELGAEFVHEVAFGADLVAKAYAELARNPKRKNKGVIATTCPAVVAYVERHHPNLVEQLAPLVSPMVAMARVIHELHGEDVRVVFIGPCVAKKGEVLSEFLAGEVSVAVTFSELRELFQEFGVTEEEAVNMDFDPPRAGSGALFPISRGMLQAANMQEDLLDGRVAVADGRADFVEALREFSLGQLDADLLEVLACQGCVMGPGVTDSSVMFTRRRRVREYAQEVLKERNKGEWLKWLDEFANINLERSYREEDQRFPSIDNKAIVAILKRIGKTKPEDELNCGACGYDTCREHAVAIHLGLAEQEMCLPRTIETLKRTVKELEQSHLDLATTQEALLHSEKLASMGQLAAGIAHEVNNPLGVVLMYAHLLADENNENEELNEDLKLIVEQADRCKKIVAGLLHFSRQNKVFRQPVKPKQLLKQALKAASPPDNVEVVVECDCKWKANLDPDQMVQVFTNLISNAYAAMANGGTLTLRAKATDDDLSFEVADTGSGIPESIRAKIFEPFFTTKQLGKGTGLGLSVTYGIVKMHGGSLSVETNAVAAKGPTGTTFTVTLPLTGSEAKP